MQLSNKFVNQVSLSFMMVRFTVRLGVFINWEVNLMAIARPAQISSASLVKYFVFFIFLLYLFSSFCKGLQTSDVQQIYLFIY